MNTSVAPKHLHRSSNDKVFAGVCGGLAEYTNMDGGMMRFLWIMVTIFSGILPGVLAYIVAAIILPGAPTPEEPVT